MQKFDSRTYKKLYKHANSDNHNMPTEVGFITASVRSSELYAKTFYNRRFILHEINATNDHKQGRIHT